MSDEKTERGRSSGPSGNSLNPASTDQPGNPIPRFCGKTSPSPVRQGERSELFDMEYRPLYGPQEILRYDPREILRERRRRDRHRLLVLFGLLGYLLVCAVGAAWLATRRVEPQTLTLLLQVFVISLIPVIVLVIREFTRKE